jgi:hypothetical protein
MYAVAITGDVLGFFLGWIPGVSMLISVTTGLALFLVGSHQGVNIYSTDHIGFTLSVFIAESVPIVGMVPLWTIRVRAAKKKANQSL